jgi:hypothetical protein
MIFMNSLEFPRTFKTREEYGILEPWSKILESYVKLMSKNSISTLYRWKQIRSTLYSADAKGGKLKKLKYKTRKHSIQGEMV